MTTRHFLTLQDLSTDEINQVIQLAIDLKAAHREGASNLYWRARCWV